jgi:hypothetical protein
MESPMGFKDERDVTSVTAESVSGFGHLDFSLEYLALRQSPKREWHVSNIQDGGHLIMSQGVSYRIALLQWLEDDGISEMMYDELTSLGHHPVYFIYGAPIPAGVDVVLSHGPHGELLPLWQQVAQASPSTRPRVVHWNTEGFPDLRLPSALMWALAAYRSRIAQLKHAQRSWLRMLANRPPIAWMDRRMHRFRYIGDYEVAFRSGLLDVLADSSQIYGRIFSQRGIPTLYAPYGATRSVYDDLDLERDIDVLWMGKRGTRRRSGLLDRIRRELKSYGVEMYVADSEENPFIFRETRTRFLNRAKVTLNITRTWYDDNFSRFALAAPNRSLVVSEPVSPHCPEYEAGRHYVSAPIDRLAESIVYYLTHDEERQVIVENAYQLVTTELAFRHSIARLMDGATKHRTQHAPAFGTAASLQGQTIAKEDLVTAEGIRGTVSHYHGEST